MMKMKINLSLLEEQTKMCVQKIYDANDDNEADLFIGIENLLNSISEAVENEEVVQFVGITEE